MAPDLVPSENGSSKKQPLVNGHAPPPALETPGGANSRTNNPNNPSNNLSNLNKVGSAPVPRLMRIPNSEYQPESYEDVDGLEYPPAMYSAMERYLPSEFHGAPRTQKLALLQQILSKYRPGGERTRLQRHREYRERIRQSYQHLHGDLYCLDPEVAFARTFLDAIKDGSLEAFKRIMSEPSPGIFTFDIFQMPFCAKILDEVEHFERWATDAKVKIMRPNTMNKYGAVLDDIGMDSTLDQLMRNFVAPMASVLFKDVGGSSLDSHHGFVVEYSMDRDLELGFHVDDSEVTLNVCLGKEFSGGELYFRGMRCDKHVNGESLPGEVLDYYHVPGKAVLHAGRHRHGAKAITSGQRTNLILWCRSSEFRELKKYQTDFSTWCGDCQNRKKERRRRLANPKR